MATIDSFKGEYAFLSNFHPSPVKYGGDRFPTVEHAYQAAKFQNVHLRHKIGQANTPGAAKRQAQLWPIETDNWNVFRLYVMQTLVTRKFQQNPILNKMLLATQRATLIEGNNWGDRFWGQVDGVGENHLGRILMDVRDDIWLEDL